MSGWFASLPIVAVDLRNPLPTASRPNPWIGICGADPLPNVHLIEKFIRAAGEVFLITLMERSAIGECIGWIRFCGGQRKNIQSAFSARAGGKSADPRS